MATARRPSGLKLQIQIPSTTLNTRTQGSCSKKGEGKPRLLRSRSKPRNSMLQPSHKGSQKQDSTNRYTTTITLRQHVQRYTTNTKEHRTTTRIRIRGRSSYSSTTNNTKSRSYSQRNDRRRRRHAKLKKHGASILVSYQRTKGVGINGHNVEKG